MRRDESRPGRNPADRSADRGRPLRRGAGRRPAQPGRAARGHPHRVHLPRPPRPASAARRESRRRPPAPARLLQAAWLKGSLPPVELLSGRADVFHGTNFVLPPRRRAAGVLMIHDLAYEKLPEVVTAASLRYRSWYPGPCGTRGSWSPPPPARLRTRWPSSTGSTGHGSSHAARGHRRLVRSRSPRRPDWLAEHGLPERYLLFVGSLEPRKNLKILLEAHARARAENPDVPTLVLVGPPGWGEAVEQPATEWSPPATSRTPSCASWSRARSPSPCPHGTRDSGCLCSRPSPRGLPSSPGRVPALQEISAGLAPIVDPDDVEGLAHEIVTISTTESSAGADARRQRAREFTWRRCAETTMRAYHQATGTLDR